MENNNERYTSYYPYDTWELGGSDPYGLVYSEGSLYKYSIESQSENTQLFATTRFQFGDLFLKAQFSYLNEDLHNEWFDVSGQNFKIVDVPDFSAFVKEDISANSYQADIRSENYFGILSLDYDDKYLFDVLSKINLNDSDALFVSCTALPVLSLINDLEKKLGKFVVSSNQALIWDSLNQINSNINVVGYGKLFNN